MAKISFIIPIGPEEIAWQSLWKDLVHLDGGCQIILSATKAPLPEQQNLMDKRAKTSKALWLMGTAGRAKQLNAGAEQATSDWLCFLHADSRLTRDSLTKLQTLLASGSQDSLYYFNLNFRDGSQKFLLLNTWGTRLRNRTWGVPYGDQGLTIHRKSFENLGGFNETILSGEDHEFVWRALARGYKLTPIGAPIQTSARKYDQQGWVLTTLRHNLLGCFQAWQFGWKPRLQKLSRGQKPS